jgi:hypothetical protein
MRPFSTRRDAAKSSDDERLGTGILRSSLPPPAA